MTDRTLIITSARNSSYRHLCIEDSTALGESPIALKLGNARRGGGVDRWLLVSDQLAIYDDFKLSDDVIEIATEAEAMGVEAEWKTLGLRPKPTWGERIARLVG